MYLVYSMHCGPKVYVLPLVFDFLSCFEIESTIVMAPVAQDPREQLLKSLRGSSMILPDITTLLCPWPQAVNPNLDRVRCDTEKFIERYGAVFSIFIGDNRTKLMFTAYFPWVNGEIR